MLGGFAPIVEGFLERLGLPRVLAFRSGLLIAVSLTDVLPEGWRMSAPAAGAAAAGAIALGWLLHHGEGEHAGHELTHPHVGKNASAHLPALVAALIGHSLVDGLNLGATALVGGPALIVVGAATSLHKIADGFTLTSLFHETGHPRGRVLALLVIVSVATPLGAVLARSVGLCVGPWLAALLLGFAGGSFLFVGAVLTAPLLRRRDLTAVLWFGVGLGALILVRFLAE